MTGLKLSRLEHKVRCAKRGLSKDVSRLLREYRKIAFKAGYLECVRDRDAGLLDTYTDHREDNWKLSGKSAYRRYYRRKVPTKRS